MPFDVFKTREEDLRDFSVASNMLTGFFRRFCNYLEGLMEAAGSGYIYVIRH